MADLGYAFGLEPEAAVKYFEGLGYKVPDNWQATWTAAQAKARAIAGLHKQELAGHFHGALYEAMKQGTPFEAWRDDVKKRLADAGAALLKDGDIVDTASGEIIGSGITKQRLETIFRTQTQNAYMAGKWQSFEETRDFAPYLQYSAILDGRTRQSHAAAHGAVYHIDDPFWDYFYPPNGFNCRCTVRALSDGDLKRRGLSVRESVLEDTNIIINKKGDTRRAKVLKMPDGSRLVADRGFEGNVGKSHLANLGRLQMEKALDLPPRLSGIAVNEAMKDPRLMQAAQADFSAGVDRVVQELAQGKAYPRGQVWHLGAILPEVVVAVEAQSLVLQTAVISMDDGALYHMLRDDKRSRKQAGAATDKALPLDFVKRLPALLQTPQAVLYEIGRSRETLLYVYDMPGNQAGKLVIKLNSRFKKPILGDSKVGNAIESGEVILLAKTLQDGNKYRLVWGSI